MRDDGLDARGYPKAFDMEGVPKQPVTIVEDGVARDVVWDRRTAKHAGDGHVSTGHALAPSGAGASARSPSTWPWRGGSAGSVDELAEAVGDGIYVTRLHYLGIVDPREGIITGMTRDGTFRIEGGKVTTPVVNLRFTTSFPALAGRAARPLRAGHAREPERLLRRALPVRHARPCRGDGFVHSRRDGVGPGPLMPVVLVGTRKGLFVLESDEDRREWRLEGPQLPGWSIFHAVVDPRDGTIYAASNNEVFGATVHRSHDRGKSWARTEELGLPEESGLKLEKTWHVEPGRDGEDGRLWLGAAPGVLFRTDDGGETWDAVEGILRHETRDRWNPGAGGMCCHSIALDPDEPERMYIGISAAGVFRSEDGGETLDAGKPRVRPPTSSRIRSPTWASASTSCSLHPGRPERLWQQNHCGVYRSDDRGESWERLEGNGLPSGFGFPLALDHRDPDTAFVVPEGGGGRPGDVRRTPGRLPDARRRLFVAAAHRGPARNGHGAWCCARAFSSDRLDPPGIYLGTQSGSLFVSPDAGETWLEAVDQLPPILSVEAGEWR